MCGQVLDACRAPSRRRPGESTIRRRNVAFTAKLVQVAKNKRGCCAVGGLRNKTAYCNKQVADAKAAGTSWTRTEYLNFADLKRKEWDDMALEDQKEWLRKHEDAVLL